MTIEIENYILEQRDDRFDLFQIKETDPNHRLSKGETNERLVTIGYSMPLKRCLEKMIYNNLNDRKDVVSLREFLNCWKSEEAKLESLLKGVMNA